VLDRVLASLLKFWVAPKGALCKWGGWETWRPLCDGLIRRGVEGEEGEINWEEENIALPRNEEEKTYKQNSGTRRDRRRILRKQNIS